MKFLTALLIIFAFLPVARAVVNVEGTRVIIHQGELSASLTLSNSEKQPTMVQIWSDNGDPLTPPEKTTAPLIAVPPVFSMKPGEVRVVQIMLTSTGILSKDKESLFWLNIYQIPPNTAGVSGVMQVVLPLRLRMKVFIRPEGVDDPVEQDGNKLLFSLQSTQNGQNIVVKNPTPWHMTLTNMSFMGTGIGGVIVEPVSSVSIPVELGKGAQPLKYELINDHGTRWAYTTIRP
ncbi:fimbria/pilus periplasmic chaperone [Enterobacter vonholyi]|uniref:fimbria/pilus periplasmic chaperone n=1 Tax=Enterobacter vonholyi TaxID=2797505 RepID=UPI0032B576BC